MSDIDPLQPNPDPDGAGADSAAETANGAPPPALSPAAPALQGVDDKPAATIAPSPRGRERLKHRLEGRRGIWAAVALLCVAVGIAGSVLGARAVARSNAANAGQAYPRTSAGIARTSSEIASKLNLAIQHQEDLVIGASTFFAGHPKASAAEFTTWVKWSQALHRYPELEKLGLVALVRTAELAAFEAQLSGRAAKPSQSRSPLPKSGALHPVPAGARPYYCFAAVELARGAGRRAAPAWTTAR